MKNPLKRMRDYFFEDLWNIDRSSLKRPRAFLLDAARLFAVLVKDIVSGQLTLRVMGLVYTTLMSFVPLLAVGFSVLKAFGVQNMLEPFLLDLLAPLGPDGGQVARKIVEFVNNMKVGVLGTVGLGLLMYTVISLVQKIEEAFNSVWRARGLRNIMRRFSGYLSVVLVGPVLIASALALTGSLMSTSIVQRIAQIEPLGVLLAAAGKAVPYVIVCASFTFLYLLLPNARIRWSSALAGGIFGGVLWQTVGWGFASFIVASTKYAAIYSSFAILILFMTWLYLSWLILLLGCEVSFYYQNPELLSIDTTPQGPNARLIEQAALSIMVLTADHYYHGRPAVHANTLVQLLGIGRERVEESVEALKKRGLIVETIGEPPGYVPGRDLDTVLLRDVYDAVRRRPENGAARRIIVPAEAAKVALEVDKAIAGALGERSIKDIIRREGTQSGEKTVQGLEKKEAA